MSTASRGNWSVATSASGNGTASASRSGPGATRSRARRRGRAREDRRRRMGAVRRRSTARVAAQQRRLRAADDAERVAQVPLLGPAEQGRRQMVVGLLPGSHLLCLVPQPQVGDELEGVLQVLRALLLQLAVGGGRGQPCPRAHFGNTRRERVGARQFDDGADTAPLDVQRVAVLASPLHHETAEDAEGWLVRGGPLGQVQQEHLRGPRPLAHLRRQPGVQGRVPGHRSHVEEDAALQRRLAASARSART